MEVRLVSSNNAPREVGLALEALKTKEYIWWRTGNWEWVTEGLAVRTVGDSSMVHGILTTDGCSRGEDIDQDDFRSHRIGGWSVSADPASIYYKVINAELIRILQSRLLRSNGERINDGRQMRDGLQLDV
jgi:hypothetical protein